MRARLQRLRASALVVVQAALAASVAWLIATEILGHERPFFAPVSALICLGLTLGQRPRRAVEMVAGVAIGILVADLIVIGLGSGAWQLGLVILLAMTAAILLGGGPLLATQAAVSAALVVTLQPPGSGQSGIRFADALVGGATALAVGSLLLPADPLAMVRRAARPVLDELAGTLDDVADALDRRDREVAVAAVLRGRAIDAEHARFAEALDVGRETARTAPPRRAARAPVEAYAIAAAQVDLAVRNVGVLARGTMRAIDLDDNVPPQVPGAVRMLAEAVRSLAVALEGGEGEEAVRANAVRAAAQATAVLEQTGNLSVSVLVGQVRATAVALLRGLGDTPAEARAAVRGAATPGAA